MAPHLIFYWENWWKCGVFSSWDLMAPTAQSKHMKRLCNDRDIWRKTEPRTLKTETPALRLELRSPRRCSLTVTSVSELCCSCTTSAEQLRMAKLAAEMKTGLTRLGSQWSKLPAEKSPICRHLFPQSAQQRLWVERWVGGCLCWWLSGSARLNGRGDVKLAYA